MTATIDYRRSPRTIHRVISGAWYCYDCLRWNPRNAERCGKCDLTPHELELEHIARIRRELAEAVPVQQELFP